MRHTPNTRTTTRDGRRHYKVTCSCGHAIVTTDSQTTAMLMKEFHATTPECPRCHHRNVHDHTGCTYVAAQTLAVEGLRTCTCKVGAVPIIS